MKETEKDSTILEDSNNQPLSPPQPIGWWMPLLCLLASGIAVVSIVLTRGALEGQATLADRLSTMQQELERAKSRSESTPLGEKQSGEKQAAEKKAVESKSVASQPNPAPIAPSVPSIRLVREPVEISADDLQAELEQAVSDLRNQFPKLPDALHVAAMMKAQTRQYSEAKELWQECIRLAPKQEIYCVNLASIAMEIGDNQLAIRALDEGEAQGFESFDFRHHRAIALAKLGRYEESIATIQKAMLKSQNDSSNWILLGQAQLELGKPAEAEASFRKALELGAASPSVFVGLGNACARQGNRLEAAKHLKTYTELMNRDKLSGQERYQVLSEKEIRKTATTVFTEAATVYFRQKDNLQTERLLMRCVALAPKDMSGLRALADLYFKTKMLAEERVVRERILELGQPQFRDLVDLAKICSQLQDNKSAEAALKMAMTLNPSAIEPYATLSQFHLQAGDLSKARWYAQQSIERQPTAEGFRFLASICQKQKDEIGASQALKLAQQLERETKYP